MQYQNLVAAKAALMKKGREYDMNIAIFVARNRLTFYNNGGLIGKVHEGEEEAKKCFYRYALVQNMLVYAPERSETCSWTRIPSLRRRRSRRSHCLVC